MEIKYIYYKKQFFFRHFFNNNILFRSPLCANEARWVYNLDELPNTTLSVQNGVVDYSKYQGNPLWVLQQTKVEYARNRAELVKSVRRLFPG
jgi:hypothetical protein